VKPELIDNAGEVFRKAWSVRLLAAAAVLDGAQLALQLLTPEGRAPMWFVVTATLVTIAAFAARFLAQQSLSGSANATPDK
jgi:hypothetical protein